MSVSLPQKNVSMIFRKPRASKYILEGGTCTLYIDCRFALRDFTSFEFGVTEYLYRATLLEQIDR